MAGSLSSCDHLHAEKPPSVKETNGTAAGSGPLADPAACEEAASKLQHTQNAPFFYFHHSAASTCNLEPDYTLFISLSPLFTVVEEGETPPTHTHNNELVGSFWETLQLFFQFPVRSAGESFSTSCQKQKPSATRPHRLLHTDLILRPRQDLLVLLLQLTLAFSCRCREGSMCFHRVVETL